MDLGVGGELDGHSDCQRPVIKQGDAASRTCFKCFPVMSGDVRVVVGA